MSIASSCHRFGLRPEEGAGCVGEGSPKAVGAARLATGQQREGMWLGELPCRAMPCGATNPNASSEESYLYWGSGARARRMPWLREGEAGCLVACERRPTNSFSVVSQPHPLRRQGENPILEASFPALSIQGRERYFYLVLQVGLETPLSGCFIACMQIKLSRVPHKTLCSSKPQALLCCLCPVLSFCSVSLSSSSGNACSRLPQRLTHAQ